MLKVRHVTGSLLRWRRRLLLLLLLLGKTIPCLSLCERIKSFSEALLRCHAIVVVAH